MGRIAALLAIGGLLAGCQGPESAPAPQPPAGVSQEAAKLIAGAPSTPDPVLAAVHGGETLPRAAESVSDAVVNPVVQATATVAQVLPEPPAPPPPADDRQAACRAAAASLIIRWEITSPAYYRRRLAQPVYPGGASGVTWGVGYDGGHQIAAVILDDWHAHLARERLATTAGVTGAKAKAILPRYRDITTEYAYAAEIFETRTLIEYERRARRAFGKGFEDLQPNACASLVSLVYNRGASMTGDSRREMKNIRDHCVPAADNACIAREIRSMKRLWKGTSIEAGMDGRREAEALLAEET